MALVHHLPVAATYLPSFPLSLQRVEDLASRLQFNMCIKVIREDCHKRSAVQGTGRALLVPHQLNRENFRLQNEFCLRDDREFCFGIFFF